jgi:hypothetical protein
MTIVHNPFDCCVETSSNCDLCVNDTTPSMVRVSGISLIDDGCSEFEIPCCCDDLPGSFALDLLGPGCCWGTSILQDEIALCGMDYLTACVVYGNTIEGVTYPELETDHYYLVVILKALSANYVFWLLDLGTSPPDCEFAAVSVPVWQNNGVCKSESPVTVTAI